MPPSDPRAALDLFGLPPGLEVIPVSEGYINDTYRLLSGAAPAYILQRINGEVFPDPGPLMENLEYIIPFLQDPAYHPPELVRTTRGSAWGRDARGNAWRLYRYIPGSGTRDARTPGATFETGRILGAFHRLLAQADPNALHTILPRFHNLDWRMQQLGEASRTGFPERLGRGRALLERARGIASECAPIPWERMPLRICHNDPKLSNVLFDLETGKALCLIDLDTIMPGYLLYDFGDAVRSLAYPSAEDEPGAGEQEPDLEAFKECCRGFANERVELHDAEADQLPHGLVYMPLLHGVRALTDYFMGDRYYKVTDPEQNLRRAQNLIGQAGLALRRLPELKTVFRKYR